MINILLKKKKILNDERETIEYNKRKVREKVKEKLNQLRLKKLNNNNTHQNRLTEHTQLEEELIKLKQEQQALMNKREILLTKHSSLI